VISGVPSNSFASSAMGMYHLGKPAAGNSRHGAANQPRPVYHM
jgi:hypothetical protein